MATILYFRAPRGAVTSTTSPFLRPMIALPTGDSFESLFSEGFASAEPTIVYSNVLLAAMSFRRTTDADRDDAFRDVLLLEHAGGAETLLERRDAMLEHRLLVLRVVVLRVLGDVAELARVADTIGDLPPLLGREVLDLVLELRVSLFGEDDFVHDHCSKEKDAAG